MAPELTEQQEQQAEMEYDYDLTVLDYEGTDNETVLEPRILTENDILQYFGANVFEVFERVTEARTVTTKNQVMHGYKLRIHLITVYVFRKM